MVFISMQEKPLLIQTRIFKKLGEAYKGFNCHNLSWIILRFPKILIFFLNVNKINFQLVVVMLAKNLNVSG